MLGRTLVASAVAVLALGARAPRAETEPTATATTTTTSLSTSTSTSSTTTTTAPVVDCFREIAPEYRAVDVPSLIRVRTAADVDRVRSDLIREIWKVPQLSSALPHTITLDVSNPLTDFVPPPGTRVDELTVEMGNYVARSYVFTPPRPRRRLVIVHQGHAHYFGNARVGDAARALLERRYIVVASFMPLFGPNTGPFPPYPLLHDLMWSLETPTFSPISIFLEPVVRTINYASTRLRIRRIAMLGLSGWARAGDTSRS